MWGAIKVNDVEIELEDGYLDDERQWNPDVAKFFAKEDGIILTDRHWEIINLIRDYYQKFQIAPLSKVLIRMLKNKYGENFNADDFGELFPGNYSYRMAIKYSGLRKCG